MLSQIQDNHEHVTGYYSRCLNKAERNYCVTRKELLAVVVTVEHLNYFLYGRKFTIRTDHSALQWLNNFRNIQGQLARWLQKLQQYNFSVLHRPGNRHHNADTFSRRPCFGSECKYCLRAEEGHDSSKNERTNNQQRVCITNLNTDEALTCGGIQNMQLEDEEIGPILGWLANSSNRPTWSVVAPYGKTTKILWAQWDSLRVLGNKLYRLWEGTTANASHLQLIVPKKKRFEVLQQLHGSTTSRHFGVKDFTAIETEILLASMSRRCEALLREM